MIDIADFEHCVLISFYNAIPTLDSTNDWLTWNQKVDEFIRISAVADDGINPPVEEDAAQQWTHRQKFYSAMIARKLTDQAAQRINAFDIGRVQPLIKAIKDKFSLEGFGTYAQLQRPYISFTKATCGSGQADIVNDREEDGNIIEAAPKCASIENKEMEEEHSKGQLDRPSTGTQAPRTIALTQNSENRKVTPSLDGTTCRIEMYNVPYCSFCQKPYHIEPECFKKNPSLKDLGKYRNKRTARTGISPTDTRESSKKRPSTDDEDDDGGGPRDLKRPSIMATT